MNSQHDTVVETPLIKDLINRSLLYLNSGFPVHFTGPTGIGKTTIALAVANELKRPFKIIRGHQEMSNQDLLGGMVGFSNKTVEDNYIHSVYKKEVRTRPIWTNGQLVDAARNGYTVIYDEFNRSTPEINNIFLSVLEEKVLPLYGLLGASGSEPYIQVHPDFRILFISNPDEYVGVYALQDALLDRMITIDFTEIDFNTYVKVVVQKTGVSLSNAKKVSSLAHRVLLQQADIRYPSLRVGIMIANIAQKGAIPFKYGDPRFEELAYDIMARYVKREGRRELKAIIKKEMLHIHEEKQV